MDARRGRKIAPTPEVSSPKPVKPRGIWPCIAYLVVDFGRPMSWVPVLNLVRPGMLVAIWGFAAILFMRNRPPVPKPVKYMLGLLALMALQVPFAMNNRWALWGLEDFLFLVVGGVIPLAMLASDLASVRTLLTAYVTLHVPMALYGLIHNGYGPSGWELDNNDLALALNAGLGVAVFLFLEASSMIRKLWLGAIMVLMLAGVVATNSRGGFVGLVLLALFVFVVSPRRRKLVVSACLVLCILGVLLFAPPRFFDRMNSIETASAQGDTGFLRLYAWGMAWEMFLDHPIFGVGTNNYGIQAPNYENQEFADQTGRYMWGRASHSIYFTLLSEHGLIGTVLFALIVFWTFSARSKIRKRARAASRDPDAVSADFFATGLLAGAFGVLASGAFLSVLYYPVFWVLVGLMAALLRVAPVPAAAVSAVRAAR